jgi:hypothetical protein
VAVHPPESPFVQWIRVLQEQGNQIERLRLEVEEIKQTLLDRSSAAPQVPTASIRFIHGVPDAPAVDIWVDGIKLVTHLVYRYASRYFMIPAGEHRIKVVPHNRTTPVLIHATVQLNPGTAYSVVAVGTQQKIRPLITVDAVKPVSGELSTLSILHAAPDVPAVDVVLADGRKAAANLMFGQITSPLEVPAGPFSATIQLAGTNQTVLTLPVTMLRPGVNYTVMIVGLISGIPSLEAVVIPNLL